MSGHTPGPWHAGKGGRVHSSDARLLASAWHPEKMPDANDERRDGESWLDAQNRLAPERGRIEAEMEANARLIAAAPELLDGGQAVNALVVKAQAILTRFLMGRPSGLDRDDAITELLGLFDGPQQREAQKKLSDAIAKAMQP